MKLLRALLALPLVLALVVCGTASTPEPEPTLCPNGEPPTPSCLNGAMCCPSQPKVLPESGTSD